MPLAKLNAYGSRKSTKVKRRKEVTGRPVVRVGRSGRVVSRLSRQESIRNIFLQWIIFKSDNMILVVDKTRLARVCSRLHCLQ